MFRLARRTASAVVATLSSVAITGCAEIYQGDALSVGDSHVSIDHVNAVVEQLAEADQMQIVEGRIEGDAIRSLLDALIRNEATHAMLDEYGLAVSDADRADVLDQFTQDPQFELLGTELQELLVSLNAQDLALARVRTPSREALAAMYAKSPVSVGALCMRHILVPTREEAVAARDRVLAGEDFATVSADVSIEPNADKTGGALAGENSDCLPVGIYQEQFDNKFTVGALAARAGTPSEPVKTSFGYHVILVRPFDEVADSIENLISEQPGQTLLVGYLASTKITVASRYGHWDPSVGRIVAN